MNIQEKEMDTKEVEIVLDLGPDIGHCQGRKKRANMEQVMVPRDLCSNQR